MTPLELKAHLATQIHAEMDKLGHSLRGAAKFTGINHSQVNSIRKRNLGNISVQSLVEAAKLYGIEVPPEDQIPKKALLPSPAEKTQLVDDHYVIHCIKNHNYDGHEITPAEIEERRALILERRAARKKENRDPTNPWAYNQKQNDKYRDNLADHYMRHLIKTSRGYKGGEITAEMIETKRQQVLAHRRKRGLS